MNPFEFLGQYLLSQNLSGKNSATFNISQNGNNWTISCFQDSDPIPAKQNNEQCAQDTTINIQSIQKLPLSSQKTESRGYEEWLSEQKKFEDYGKALTKAKQGVYVKPYITGEGKYIAAHIRKFPNQPQHKKSTEVDAKLKFILEQ